MKKQTKLAIPIFLFMLSVRILQSVTGIGMRRIFQEKETVLPKTPVPAKAEPVKTEWGQPKAVLRSAKEPNA